MSFDTVGDLVQRIERIASTSELDAVITNQVSLFLEYHRYKPAEKTAYSDEEWRGVLLAATDLLSPTHPKREQLRGALMAAMRQSSELERTG